VRVWRTKIADDQSETLFSFCRRCVAVDALAVLLSHRLLCGPARQGLKQSCDTSFWLFSGQSSPEKLYGSRVDLKFAAECCRRALHGGSCLRHAALLTFVMQPRNFHCLTACLNCSQVLRSQRQHKPSRKAASPPPPARVNSCKPGRCCGGDNCTSCTSPSESGGSCSSGSPESGNSDVEPAVPLPRTRSALERTSSESDEGARATPPPNPQPDQPQHGAGRRQQSRKWRKLGRRACKRPECRGSKSCCCSQRYGEQWDGKTQRISAKDSPLRQRYAADDAAEVSKYQSMAEDAQYYALEKDVLRRLLRGEIHWCARRTTRICVVTAQS
jgi:hypothetical protein